MNRLTISLSLTLTPLMVLAYHHALKVALSNTDAARYLEDGGSIARSKLSAYKLILDAGPALGILTAVLLAREVSDRIKTKAPQ